MQFFSILSLLLATRLISCFQLNFRSSSDIPFGDTEKRQSYKKVNKALNFGASLIIGCSFLSFPTPSYSQIPSMDEYNTASGTVLPGRKKVVGKPESAVVKAAPEVFNPMQVRITLAQIDQYISDDPAKWDEITRDIKLIPKYNSKNLGFASSTDLANNFKISSSQAKDVESAREDFAFNVGLLKDLALANRVYFFNKADLEQQELIKEAAEPPSKAAVKEAQDIIKDIKTSFATLEESLAP